jgi:V/A-type H+-transporting ATPase subunit I
MIEPMAKLRLACPCSLADRVTAMLQEAGVFHIESTPAEAQRGPLRRQVLDEPGRRRKAEMERLREELRRLLLLLPEASPRGSADRRQSAPTDLTEQDTKRLTRLVRHVGSRVDYLTRQIKECEDELALLSRYEKALDALAPFLSLIQESAELDYVGVTIEEGQSGDGAVLPLLREMMAGVTEGRFELFHARLDERSLAILLVFPKPCAARIRGLLWEEGISELRLPASVSDKPLGQALRIILKKKVDLPIQAQRLRDKLADLARVWFPEVAHYQDAVCRRLEQMEAAAFFYQTELATIIFGWTTRRALPALTERISREFGGKVVLEETPIHKADWTEVPVVLRNPGALKPFEALTRLIALPRYGSIDPTPFLAVFFPLFYGMILGDVGYGMLIFGVALVARRRYGRHALVRELAAVFLWAAGVAILFGVLFGEVFGELGERVGLHPLLNRMEAFLPLLYLSVGLGTAHVALGIVLGAVWAWRQEERHELLAKLGGLLLVFAFVGLIASLAGLLPRHWVPYGLAALMASLAVIFGFGGARGAMEIHNLVNVLSYLRIMGIGVASAALAFAANKLGGMVGNLLLAVAIGGTLHVVNLVFGTLSPAIQSLRLHYVEFFENFFAPGGRPYKPFRRAT